MYIGHSVRVAALALDVPLKWIDNVLSHHELPSIVRTTHGVARQLGEEGILALALCKTMVDELGVPIARACALAREIVRERGAPSVRVAIAPHVVLDVALDELQRRLRSRITDAAEAVAHVRRGRPPRKRAELE